MPGVSHRLNMPVWLRRSTSTRAVTRGCTAWRMPAHVDHLTWFTAESFGGPDRFTRELGFQYIIDVHRHLKITDEQRERFIAVYLETLDEAGLPADAPFRQAVREHVEFGSHVAQQNSWAKSDADLHPIRAVPAWSWPDDPQDH